ncbi:M66 family metalloprotease [Pseudomonas sp. NPDC089569]|uniref:M66 family metalloprotease n=1 Tax=Pseudomonas sp. NPDC089569 TaxID=3390722 RepID=UPI003D073764
MFQTAGGCSIRRVFSALSMVSLAALLGACAHSSPPDPGVPKSWVVENVASKSTAELYAEVIKPGVFERSSSKVIDGYTVESGNLRMPDKSIGSLITVRGKDGSLTAAIEEPGKSGWFVINSKGEGHFNLNPTENYTLPDAIVDKEELKKFKPSTTAGPYVIDMLVGFSRKAVEVGGGDATANALALVEGVNLALRNSQVHDVSMRLVGVQVIEQNYPIVGDTLNKIEGLFSAGIQQYEPDMVAGVFGGHPEDNAGGYGFAPGRITINHNSMEVFRHEVGHNAGGMHCAHDGGGVFPYGYGFANGKTFTAQCGNSSPYYSTPAVRDTNGLPIGDAATADMARVWRENAERLSSYAFGPPRNFKKTGSTITHVTFGWDPVSKAVRYDVYSTILAGPEVKKIAEVTGLTYTVADTFGRTIYYVKAVDADGKESKLSNGASR